MNFLRALGISCCLLLGWPIAPAHATRPGTLLQFTSLDKEKPLHVSGTLYLPASGTAPFPAIVMVHGTSGINTVGAFYKDAVLQAGIAIFEVDFKTGIYAGPMDRPSIDVLESMGFAALRELRGQTNIDPARIGIMGFSMGGYLTVSAAFEATRERWMDQDKGFATHIGFYPICRALLRQRDLKPTGAPILILYGTNDSYGEGEYAPKFKRTLLEKYNFEVQTVEYPGAQHDFNRNEPPLTYRDPSAIGGVGHMEWNAEAANDSLPRVVNFLRETLHVK